MYAIGAKFNIIHSASIKTCFDICFDKVNEQFIYDSKTITWNFLNENMISCWVE